LPRAQQLNLRTISTKSSALNVTTHIWCHNYKYKDMS
jgi:hypothetical protein